MILIAAKLVCITLIMCTCVICGTISYVSSRRNKNAIYIYTNDNGEYKPVGALKANE